MRGRSGIEDGNGQKNTERGGEVRTGVETEVGKGGGDFYSSTGRESSELREAE